MQVTILGAGIIGVSTAWHLLERGHEVTLVDRQLDAALETSFANAAQISVSYCEPWANKDAPLKTLKWMFSDESPLLFRPQLDWAQWRWGLQFLAQCNDAAFVRNVAQLVALGAYSHAALKDVVADTGIEYHRLERGIAHYYTDQKSFDGAAEAAAVMQRFGVQRSVVSRAELLAIEPALRAFGERIVGGTYTETDESGDARVFTQALAERCAQAGAQVLLGHDIEQLESDGSEVRQVRVRDRATGVASALKADAFVVACGSYTTPLLKSVGVNVPIYPGKGYSATLPLLSLLLASSVSLSACNTMKGKIAPVVSWSSDLFVVDPAPIVASVDRLAKKGGRELMARCPTEADAEHGVTGGNAEIGIVAAAPDIGQAIG